MRELLHSDMRVTKAVIPAAGLGTRFLPATKATPKEMLPVVDKPAIQYVVEEAVAAGLTDVLMITGRNKRPLEDHFDRVYELEEALAAKGDLARLQQVRATSALAAMHYVRQGDPRGLGHAVACARDHVGDAPFAVLLGDDLIDPRDALLARMLTVRARYGGSVLALMEVDAAHIHLYGCAAVKPGADDDVVVVTDLVEKPVAAEAPSRLAVIGRYVLDPAIFGVLAATAPGRGGEIQLTDALRRLAAEPELGGPVHGVLFSGRRYDTGDRGEYLRTIVRLACEREDLGPEFRAWLHDFVTQGVHRPVKTVEEHLDDVLALVPDPLEPIELPLLDAHGCLLAEDVTAAGDLPPFDNSSMDGYAVRVADVVGANDRYPSVLSVVGDIPAGADAARYLITSGGTARIMTGAPMPAGAEAVVPIEWTDGGTDVVRVTRAPEEGQFIRRRGSDVTAGETVLHAGTWLGAARIGLLGAIGRAQVRVHPRPRVAVLSTGSELVEPGQQVGPGRIWESNSFTLVTAAREAGALAYRIGAVPDDPKLLLDTVEDQLAAADLVITTGGVSVGAYDVVKEVFSRLGTVRFDRVAMQPGMPQGWGTLGPDRVPVLTLPGNPVSAFVSFELFARPVIRRMAGFTSLHRPVVHARCREAFSSPPGRRQYARARLIRRPGHLDPEVTPVGGAGSHLMGDLAHADALIVVPEDQTEIRCGQTVAVILLEPDGRPDAATPLPG